VRFDRLDERCSRERNGFVTGTKLRTNIFFFFVAATKIFDVVTKRFVNRTKHFVVKNIFVIPIFNK